VQICVAGYDRHQHCTMVALVTEENMDGLNWEARLADKDFFE